MRGGACLLLVLVAAIGAASARAAGTTTATTTSATTTTATATTTTTTTTTTATTPAYGPLAGTPLPARCVGAGGVLIAEPDGTTVALDTPASDLGAAAYPEDGSLVAFSTASGSGPGCRPRHLSFSSLSLFAGAVTIGSVSGRGGHARPSRVEVNGTPVTLTSGAPVAVGDWGRLSLGGTVGRRLSAGLVLRLLRAHGSLPAGTAILIGYAETPLPAAEVAKTAKSSKSPETTRAAKATRKATSHAKHRSRHRRKRKHAMPQPLKVTPPLHQGHYVFPVDDGASYGDTYGAGRSDIYDGWHHGDDLFAPLGTPVVAVADGKLTLVGWNQLGGWRLWLTDAHGNSFYYAHLAGYSPRILHHRHVRAGQVVGFVGRTGDAFTTPPHLHFEVHPHQLLRLGYDGAVDPTSYLRRWRVVRVPARKIPRPARLVAPKGTPRQESNVVWHELLVARHLVPRDAIRRPEAVRRAFPEPAAMTAHVPRIVLPISAVRVAERVAPPQQSGPWPTVVAAVLIAVLSLGTLALRRRRRTGLS